MDNIQALILKTHKSATALRNASDAEVKKALMTMADLLEAQAPAVMRANKKDLARQDAADPRTDRLMLNEKRIQGIANSIRKVAALPNPSGNIIEKKTLPNGLALEKMAVPLGVVGAIYESRPNVTYDIAALCLRSMNACLLKGSGEAEESNKAAIKIIHAALRQNGLPVDCVTLLPSSRETVPQLFTATRHIDVIIPRGSEGLIQYVRKNSLVPVIETGAGVCHIYVEREAAIGKAVDIVVNAKVSRPSVCNAVDTVLVDREIAATFLPPLQAKFQESGVEVFADPQAFRLMKGYPFLQKATAKDFGREFLSLKCAVHIVRGIDEALAHIEQYSTRHSEAIVTQNKTQGERFVKEVDAAAVYINASTRFTDGEEFGLGAEIGISTQKLHARGPFALEKLVTEKWIVKGDGNIR